MKAYTLLSAIALFATSVVAQSTQTVSYDQTYDNAGGSTDTVSCSTGPNGLAGRFPTFGSFPQFPNIGGAAAVSGFGSAECGTCWQLTYNGNSVNVLAIDHAANGFNIALEAMNTLTDGNAVFLGRVNAEVTQVAASACGI